MIEQVTFPLMVEATASNPNLLIIIGLLLLIALVVFFVLDRKPKSE